MVYSFFYYDNNFSSLEAFCFSEPKKQKRNNAIKFLPDIMFLVWVHTEKRLNQNQNQKQKQKLNQNKKNKKRNQKIKKNKNQKSKKWITKRSKTRRANRRRTKRRRTRRTKNYFNRRDENNTKRTHSGKKKFDTHYRCLIDVYKHFKRNNINELLTSNKKRNHKLYWRKIWK